MAGFPWTRGACGRWRFLLPALEDPSDIRACGICVKARGWRSPGPIYVPRTQSGLKRLLQYAVLRITALPVLLVWVARWKPDIVWTVMPPLTGMPTALLAAKLARAPAWLHVQDFEIDAAFGLKAFQEADTPTHVSWN